MTRDRRAQMSRVGCREGKGKWGTLRRRVDSEMVL